MNAELSYALASIFERGDSTVEFRRGRAEPARHARTALCVSSGADAGLAGRWRTCRSSSSWRGFPTWRSRRPGPGYCSGPYPFRSMHPYLRQIYDAFGPTRMFWGTDITKMPCSWRQCVTMFTEELPWLSEQDKELVMGQAVCAWWGWKQPS